MNFCVNVAFCSSPFSTRNEIDVFNWQHWGLPEQASTWDALGWTEPAAQAQTLLLDCFKSQGPDLKSWLPHTEHTQGTESWEHLESWTGFSQLKVACTFLILPKQYGRRIPNIYTMFSAQVKDALAQMLSGLESQGISIASFQKLMAMRRSLGSGAGCF